MRLAWFEVGLAVFAVGVAGLIGWALQREDPGTWAAVGAALAASRVLLR